MSDVKGSDLYKHWQQEIDKAKKWFRKFHTTSEKVVKAYLDDRTAQDDEFGMTSSRLNLFYSNITTLMSMLYGQIPKVEAVRRFADPDDDVARVASQMLTRILNTDIEAAGEDIAAVFRNGLQDRLIVGLGTARLQYQMTEQKVSVEAKVDEDGTELAPGYEESKISQEWVDTVYTHWRDIMWSPARTYPEIRWKAFRSYLTKEKFKQRFPKADLKKVTFSSTGSMEPKQPDDDKTCAEAEVWEIWCKDTKTVYWWVEGYEDVLDKVDDPLQLEGFFPEPPPLISNTTTSRYIPKADYALAQDLYREIDELETRITMLTRACKVVGVYDKSQEAIKRIFTEGVENDLIGVDNWAAFSEKGGLDGSITWVPIKEIAEVISVLTDKQNNRIQQLYQVTGMNDIMRGAANADTARISATQRKLEANYGSIRIEALQNEFARWVGDLQSIKAEIIARHYSEQSIIEQSNIMVTPDAQYAAEAVKLIKDPLRARWKISVRPETLAIADYAQLKQDRVEYINGMATFLQSAAPMVELMPESVPMLTQLMKWGLAGFRGSNEIEAVIDSELDRMQKNPAPQKPDPEAQKAQAEMQKMQMEMQMQREDHQAEMQMEQQKLANQNQKMQMEIQFMQQKFELELQKLRMELGFKQQEAALKAQTTQQEQAAQFAFNTAERQTEAEFNRQERADEAKFNREDREHEQQVSMEQGEADLRRKKAEAKLRPPRNA